MVTAKELISGLRLVDENIFHEAADQPSKFKDAARYRVRKMREKYAAITALEAYEADRGLSIRHKLESKKPTERFIKSKVMNSAQYVTLKDAVHDAEAEEEFSKLLLECYRQRNDAIKVIAQAQLAEGRSASSVLREVVDRNLHEEARRVQSRYAKLRRTE